MRYLRLFTTLLLSLLGYSCALKPVEEVDAPAKEEDGCQEVPLTRQKSLGALPNLGALAHLCEPKEVQDENPAKIVKKKSLTNLTKNLQKLGQPQSTEPKKP
ncbi:MAG: hypothetical protein M1549_01040 [Candidatus Dependentiae bacterium]|nr:hypothetical protein [Candidatus Dependentiae bacterium]